MRPSCILLNGACLSHLDYNEISAFAGGEMKSSKCALNLSAGPHAASNAQAALRVSEPQG